MVNVVLFQPENAGNLGNIIRTCYIHKAILHLIRPYGWVGNLRHFKNPITNHTHFQLIRATMDCFEKITIMEHNSWNDFLESISNQGEKEIILFSIHNSLPFQKYLSTKNKNVVKKIFLVFGAETHGLNNLDQNYQNHYQRIMLEPIESDKCYNLSNAVAVSLYALHTFINNDN